MTNYIFSYIRIFSYFVSFRIYPMKKLIIFTPLNSCPVKSLLFNRVLIQLGFLIAACPVRPRLDKRKIQRGKYFLKKCLMINSNYMLLKVIVFLFIIISNGVIASSLILKSPLSAEALAKADDNSKPQLDSLKTAFNNAKHDTTKARLLVELSDVLYFSNPDTVIPLCKQALEFIDKNLAASNKDEIASFLKTKADAINNIGYIHGLQGSPDKQMAYYLRSLEIRNTKIYECTKKCNWS